MHGSALYAYFLAPLVIGGAIGAVRGLIANLGTSDGDLDAPAVASPAPARLKVVPRACA